MTSGTAFVDVSNPDVPVALGTLPTATSAPAWRDIKVYRHYAYIVADGAGPHGMQVFDLTRLRGISTPQTFAPDFHYEEIANTHNIAIDESTGFAYLVGTNTCNGGLHMVDLSSPASPVFAGCYSLAHTHDTQCVAYRGPDTEHTGEEICFSSNEDHVEIVDVTDKLVPLRLASLQYPQVGFTHQGWLSDDQSFFFLGDELDELDFGIPTRTIVLDVSDLDAPFYAFAYESTNTSTDHNLYVRGNRIYEGNYASGLRVLNTDRVFDGDISEVAFFDTYPQSDAAGFDGVWSVYPYLPSGTLLVNDRQNGLFLLTLDVPGAFATAAETAVERESIVLSGKVTGSPSVVSWVQTSGPSAVIEDAGALVTTATLPDIAAPEWLSFDLVADGGAAGRAVDTVHVFVTPYPAISSVPIADPKLRQCVDDLAAADSIADAGSVTSLNCTNVSDVAGLEAFPHLSALTLSGSSLDGLSALPALGELRALDLSGYRSLPCGQLEALEAALDPAVLLDKGTTCRASVVSELGGTAFDSAIDVSRRRIYVSVPGRQEIVAASLDTTRIVARYPTPGEPYGIDPSLDGKHLFAALRDTDSVTEVDLDTGTQRSIALNGQTELLTTHDVVEAQPNRLLVVADPVGSRWSRAVQVRLDQGDSVSPVAGLQPLFDKPALIVSPDRQFAYLGDGPGSPRLYKLSLADPLAGIVLSDGSFQGTTVMALDATGTRIALRSGQVLDTNSFAREGSIPSGTPTVSASGDRFAVNASGNRIEFFDALTLAPDGLEVVGCNLAGTADRLHSFDGDSAFALLHDSSLCLTVNVAQGTTLDPYPELHFPDLALESCVRDTARTRGWTSADEFLSLDCSALSEPVQSLEGIEALVNLSEIDVSGSDVLDLGPLSALVGLTAIAARNTGIANLGWTESMPSLASLDVTGAPNVSCQALDTLAAGGVSVSADFCVNFLSVALGGPGFDVAIDEPGSRAFVSVPALNSILEVDLNTFSIARTIVTSGPPNGIDLSEDRQTLYVALGNFSFIAYIDVATGIEQVVDIKSELYYDVAWDIAEISPDRILASASPDSSDIAFIVEVRRDLNNAAQQVAGGEQIRAEPEFVVTPDGSAVFVREGFFPPSIYKLDATQADLPIVAEDYHGALNDTQHLQISPDGALLITRSGQLISTADVGVVGQFPYGLSTFSVDGASVLVEDSHFDGVTVYDLSTHRPQEQRNWGCAIGASQRLVARDDGSVLVLGDDLLCSTQTVAY